MRHTGTRAAPAAFFLLVLAFCLAAFPVLAEAGSEIAVIVKDLKVGFWQNVGAGALEMQEELAVDGKIFLVTVDGPESETAVSRQVAMVKSAVKRGVVAIVVAPCDPVALVQPLRLARAAGIPVVLIDSALADANLYATFLATDNRAAGELCAEEMIRRLGGPDKKGEIVVLSYVAGVGSEISRVGAFREHIRKNSQIAVVDTYYSGSNTHTAGEQTGAAIDSHPNVAGFFAANEPTAIGMGRALKARGLTGRHVAIGFDGDRNLQELVRDGTIQGIAVQNPRRMGRLGVQAALDALEGKALPRFIDTGVTWVTRENLDSPQAAAVLY